MRNLNRVAIIVLMISVFSLIYRLYQMNEQYGTAASGAVSKIDTVYLQPDTVYITDTLVRYRSDTALIRRCNDVHAKYQVAKLQLRDIENYVAICRRKPDQTKFLVGWITRRLR